MQQRDRILRLRLLIEELDRRPPAPERERLLRRTRQRLAELQGAAYESSAWKESERAEPPLATRDADDPAPLELVLDPWAPMQ